MERRPRKPGDEIRAHTSHFIDPPAPAVKPYIEMTGAGCVLFPGFACKPLCGLWGPGRGSGGRFWNTKQRVRAQTPSGLQDSELQSEEVDVSAAGSSPESSPITPALHDGLQVGEGGEEACGEALVATRAGGDPKDEVRSKAGTKSGQTLGILPEERDVSG